MTEGTKIKHEFAVMKSCDELPHSVISRMILNRIEMIYEGKLLNLYGLSVTSENCDSISTLERF